MLKPQIPKTKPSWTALTSIMVWVVAIFSLKALLLLVSINLTISPWTDTRIGYLSAAGITYLLYEIKAITTDWKK